MSSKSPSFQSIERETMKHDCRVHISDDGKIGFTIYTYADDPSFRLSFSSLSTFQKWVNGINGEIEVAVKDYESKSRQLVRNNK